MIADSISSQELVSRYLLASRFEINVSNQEKSLNLSKY